MDPRGNIYPLPTGQSNPEDEARLDGYLKARAEADAAAHAEHVAELEAKFREAQAETARRFKLADAGMGGQRAFVGSLDGTQPPLHPGEVVEVVEVKPDERDSR